MIEYQNELEHALIARSDGNEGMARVCARRAAGIIIGEYLERRGYIDLASSAYDRITTFKDLSEIDPKCRVIASHFLLKVDHHHELPEDVDLLKEVQTLKEELLKDPVH